MPGVRAGGAEAGPGDVCGMSAGAVAAEGVGVTELPNEMVGLLAGAGALALFLLLTNRGGSR